MEYFIGLPVTVLVTIMMLLIFIFGITAIYGRLRKRHTELQRQLYIAQQQLLGHSDSSMNNPTECSEFKFLTNRNEKNEKINSSSQTDVPDSGAHHDRNQPSGEREILPRPHRTFLGRMLARPSDASLQICSGHVSQGNPPLMRSVSLQVQPPDDEPSPPFMGSVSNSLQNQPPDDEPNPPLMRSVTLQSQPLDDKQKPVLGRNLTQPSFRTEGAQNMPLSRSERACNDSGSVVMHSQPTTAINRTCQNVSEAHPSYHNNVNMDLHSDYFETSHHLIASVSDATYSMGFGSATSAGSLVRKEREQQQQRQCQQQRQQASVSQLTHPILRDQQPPIPPRPHLKLMLGPSSSVLTDRGKLTKLARWNLFLWDHQVS